MVAAVSLLGGGNLVANAQSDPESLAWGQAKSANSVSGYQSFLEAYPVGMHSQEAFGRMIRLLRSESEESRAPGGNNPTTHY